MAHFSTIAVCTDLFYNLFASLVRVGWAHCYAYIGCISARAAEIARDIAIEMPRYVCALQILECRGNTVQGRTREVTNANQPRCLQPGADMLFPDWHFWTSKNTLRKRFPNISMSLSFAVPRACHMVLRCRSQQPNS